VCENTTGRIFGFKRLGTGSGRLHNEELNDFYFSLNIVLVIKSRRMRWAGHVARMGENTTGRIFGFKRLGTGSGRLHNEELNDFYSSPNIVRVIKSRRMGWAGHVACMGEERWVYGFLLGKPEERNHWGELGVDGRIILGWISRRWDVGIWTGLGWPRIEKGGGPL